MNSRGTPSRYLGLLPPLYADTQVLGGQARSQATCVVLVVAVTKVTIYSVSFSLSKKNKII
jgi:hypothetical protein